MLCIFPYLPPVLAPRATLGISSVTLKLSCGAPSLPVGQLLLKLSPASVVDPSANVQGPATSSTKQCTGMSAAASARKATVKMASLLQLFIFS